MKCLFMLIFVGLKHVKNHKLLNDQYMWMLIIKNVLLLINFLNKKNPKTPTIIVVLPYELVKYFNICFKCLIKWTKKFTVFLVIQYTDIILLLSLHQNICIIWNRVYVFHTYCVNSKYKCSSNNRLSCNFVQRT